MKFIEYSCTGHILNGVDSKHLNLSFHIVRRILQTESIFGLLGKYPFVRNLVPDGHSGISKSGR